MNSPPSPANQAYAGKQDLTSDTSELNALTFVVRQILARVNTAALAVVRAVNVSNQTVDVQPLVNQIDGAGNATPHATVYGLPYFRLQGGVNAVILDPSPGDIGVCVFAAQDISSVKVSKAPGNPGSRRRFSMADGLYLGGVLNGEPQQYVEFAANEVVVSSPNKIRLVAPDIELDGAVAVTGQLTGDSDIVADGISLKTHTHLSATPGNPTSPPVP